MLPRDISAQLPANHHRHGQNAQIAQNNFYNEPQIKRKFKELGYWVHKRELGPRRDLAGLRAKYLTSPGLGLGFGLGLG